MAEKKKPIIKLWFVKPKDAWYRLSDKERQAFLKIDKELFEKTEKTHDFKSLIVRDAQWSTENWTMFGAE